MSKVIVHDYWHHFIPEAPVIQLDMYKNTSIDIDLGPYMVQGARDFYTGAHDPNVLAAINTQRGWNLNLIVPDQPAHGRALISSATRGIQYIARRNYVGLDCINYILNINGQNSRKSRIELNIQDFFEVSVQPYRQGSTNNIRYVATPTVPSSMGTGWTILYSWYHRRPVRKYNNQVGRFEIHIELVQWAGSVFDGQAMQIVIPADQTTYYPYLWPDQNLVGYIAGTDEPYLQPDGPFPLILETNFVKSPVMSGSIWTGIWAQSFKTVTDLELELGPEWWKSGQVQQDP